MLHRYEKMLKKLLHEPEMVELLSQHGLVPDDIGSHSNRKGAITLLLHGSTAGPGITAGEKRAGWKHKGQLPRYLGYGEACEFMSCVCSVS